MDWETFNTMSYENDRVCPLSRTLFLLYGLNTRKVIFSDQCCEFSA